MEFDILFNNLTNPTLLFFMLGIIAALVKSDLEIPASTSKFISLYLLFSIGFKGGQELANSPWSSEILASLLFGIILASLIPFYTFFVLKRKLSVYDAGAIAAAYGSVSAVTFVASMSFLEMQKLTAGGHMVAVMAFMESPAIIVGVILMNKFDKDSKSTQSFNLGKVLKHSLTNGSVLMIIGSLIIGVISDSKQAEGIKPFTTDIFKGFLALFLLEMGMVTAKRFKAFKHYGWFAGAFAIVIPFINGCVVAYASQFVTTDIANRFVFAVLAASASLSLIHI
jgi:hypothetical protein